MQTVITAACGCWTNRRTKEQHKCPDHANNAISQGYQPR